MSRSNTPEVSVVVSTYQRADRLPRLVHALAAQQVDFPFEVVIVDNGSTDATAAVLADLVETTALDLRIVRLATNRGPSGGRNAGWRHARGDVVAFTDDDCRPDSGWLSALHGGLADADVIQGRTVPDPDHAANWGPFSRTMRVEQSNGFFETCNIAYRRDLLAAMKGFDQTFHLTGEDTDLAWRAVAAGARTAFQSDAVVYHEVSKSSYRAHLRAIRRWGDTPLVVRRHPHLRTTVYDNAFWRRSHREALKALAGVIVAVPPGRKASFWVARIAVGGALVRPYVRLRMRYDALPCGPRRRVALLPLAWFADLVEVVFTVRAAARHRTFLL